MVTLEIANGKSYPQRQLALVLSLVLAVMVLIASGTGVLVPDFYFRETANWQAQAVGQDLVNLFVILPVLIISAFAGYLGSYPGKMIWGGSLIYLLYTFAIYSFDLHFNALFLVYCLALGLSFYSGILFFYHQFSRNLYRTIRSHLLMKITGIYFLAIALIFYILWVSEIVPGNFDFNTPEILLEIGLPTNPIHVLDLAILLPCTFITGILLLKKNKAGYFMAPVLLTFFVLMSLTIAILVIIMNFRGLEEDTFVIYIMGSQALIAAVLLIWWMASARSKNQTDA